MESDDPRAVTVALHRAVEIGITHLDTAELYGEGAVESLLGRAIGDRRDRLFLVSKVKPGNADRRGTVAACERSLKRLRTDHLDCYLLHWVGPYPIEETIAGFEELVAQGKIRSWGVSNFDEVKLADVIRATGDASRVACNQVLYHLEERAIEHAVIPYCQQHGIAVVGYSPFGSGHFPRPDSPGGTVLAQIARERGVLPHAVALAFLTRQDGLFTIPKASRVEHVEANAAGDFDLTADEIARLDRAFPLGPRRPGIPMI